MPNILILSATASAVNFQKSLSEIPEYNLFFTDANPFATSLYKKNCEGLIVPKARDLKNYQVALQKIIEKYSIDVLIPTSDHDMEGVMKLIRDGWNPPVSMFLPDFEVYHTLTHKGNLIRKVRDSSIKVPKLYDSPENVQFPVVLKPPREGGSKSVWIIDDQVTLMSKWNHLKTIYDNDLVLQEYIPGGAGSIHLALLLYDNDGELRGEVASRSTSTFMSWGGGGIAGEIVDEPGLIDTARQIVKLSGGWRGPVNLEFKRHSHTGEFYLMEVNCRLNGYSYLTTLNGLNFPKAMIELLTVGSTDFLSLQHQENRTNFIISIREKIVESFLGDN